MSTQQFSQERLMNVLLAPQISEKATYVADKNEQVVFRVATDATKPEIKAAVEMMFKVSVDSVQVACVKGKVKRSGRVVGLSLIHISEPTRLGMISYAVFCLKK